MRCLTGSPPHDSVPAIPDVAAWRTPSSATNSGKEPPLRMVSFDRLRSGLWRG